MGSVLITAIILMNVRSSSRKTTLWQPLITSMTAPTKGTIKVAVTTMDGRIVLTKVGEIILTRIGGTTITEEAETIKDIRGGIITTTDSRTRTSLTEHLT